MKTYKLYVLLLPLLFASLQASAQTASETEVNTLVLLNPDAKALPFNLHTDFSFSENARFIDRFDIFSPTRQRLVQDYRLKDHVTYFLQFGIQDHLYFNKGPWKAYGGFAWRVDDGLISSVVSSNGHMVVMDPFVNNNPGFGFYTGTRYEIDSRFYLFAELSGTHAALNRAGFGMFFNR